MTCVLSGAKAKRYEQMVEVGVEFERRLKAAWQIWMEWEVAANSEVYLGDDVGQNLQLSGCREVGTVDGTPRSVRENGRVHPSMPSPWPSSVLEMCGTLAARKQLLKLVEVLPQSVQATKRDLEERWVGKGLDM